VITGSYKKAAQVCVRFRLTVSAPKREADTQSKLRARLDFYGGALIYARSESDAFKGESQTFFLAEKSHKKENPEPRGSGSKVCCRIV